MTDEVEFRQPCGCVVVRRARVDRLPFWYIAGQVEGITQNPLVGMLGEGVAIQEVLRHYCPHGSHA